MSGDRRVEVAQEITLGAHTDETVDHFAITENMQRGYRADVVLGGKFGMSVDIDFRDDGATFAFGGDFVERWLHHAAGAAPGRPEIDDDRLLVRSTDHVAFESVVSDNNGMRESFHKSE